MNGLVVATPPEDLIVSSSSEQIKISYLHLIVFSLQLYNITYNTPFNSDEA
jgi:hypothetical protein